MYQVLCRPDTCRAVDILARRYVALSLWLAVYDGSVRTYVYRRDDYAVPFA